MDKIKIAIIGVGNCASSLVQGIFYYGDKRPEDAVGLMHWEIGGYRPADIEVVAAFDIDRRKVHKDLAAAIFAAPNCTTVFYRDLPATGVKVSMGRILDGFAEHMRGYPERLTYMPATEPEPDREAVVRILQASGAQMLLNQAVSVPYQIARLNLGHYDGVLAFGDVLASVYRSRFGIDRTWTFYEAADTSVFFPMDLEKAQDVVWIGNWGDDERSSEIHSYLIDSARALNELRFVVHGVCYPKEPSAHCTRPVLPT